LSTTTAHPRRDCGRTSAGAHTPAIVEWERGDLGPELVEVSHEQASKIIEYFRQKCGPRGQQLDS